MKTIVTHITPDLDAVTSVWLLKRFLPGWSDAVVTFVPAGQTLHGEPADNDPQILHVDTGLGMLDHHQSDEFTCAAKKTRDYLKAKKVDIKHAKVANEVLDRMVAFVTDIDHFREIHYPNAGADYYLFMATGIMDGWKRLHFDDDQLILMRSMDMLDAIYQSFHDRVWAERELEDKAIVFESPWGKGLGIEATNDEVLRTAMRQGYLVVVRKDDHKGYVRIKGIHETPVDLTDAYEKLKKKDPDATWFLHVSRKMLLNGTTHNPDMRPTKLTLGEIIEVLKKK